MSKERGKIKKSYYTAVDTMAWCVIRFYEPVGATNVGSSISFFKKKKKITTVNTTIQPFTPVKV